MEVEVIETPGHKTDHLSYAMKQPIISKDALNDVIGIDHILFAGDMILGTPSVNS